MINKIEGSSGQMIQKTVNIKFSHPLPAPLVDTLASAEGRKKNIIQRSWRKLKLGFSWISRQIKWCLSKVFFCFEKTKTQVLQEQIHSLTGIKEEFPQKRKELDDRGLKEWWKSFYHKLDHSVKNLLLEEHIRTYGGDFENNLKDTSYQDDAQDFVADFSGGTYNGKRYEPKHDIPKYIDRAIGILNGKLQAAKQE